MIFLFLPSVSSATSWGQIMASATSFGCQMKAKHHSFYMKYWFFIYNKNFGCYRPVFKKDGFFVPVLIKNMMKNESVSSTLQFSVGFRQFKLSIPFFSGPWGSLKHKTHVHGRAWKGFRTQKAPKNAVLCSKT